MSTAFFYVMYQIVVNLVFNTNSWTFLETINPGFLTQVILNKFHCSAEIMQVSLYTMFVEKPHLKPFSSTSHLVQLSLQCSSKFDLKSSADVYQQMS